MTASLADRLRRLPPASRAALFERLSMRPGALSDVRYDWAAFLARADQLFEPSDLHRYGLILITGARGEGKTRTAVELFNREIFAGRARRPRIFAATEPDIDKAVVHGESGIMACLPRELRPRWMADEGPAGTLRYPNGTEVVCFSARASEGAVGHNSDLDLYDDVAKWGVHAATAWAHARLSCRIGYMCGIVATTRRGTRLLTRLLKGNVEGVLVRRLGVGTNAGNLAAKWRGQMAAELDGSDLLGQELDDEDTGDGKVFDGVNFGEPPVRVESFEPVEVVVSIDPATSSATSSCEVGVVVDGIDARDHLCALEDVSGIMTEQQWPTAALDAAERWERRGVRVHVLIENNKGGNMGRGLIQLAEKIRRLQRGLPAVNVLEVREVTVKPHDSKARRGGSTLPLYRAGQVHHLPGLGKLERQLRELDEQEGPKRDRADAHIHGLRDLARIVDRPAEERHGSADTFEGLEEANAKIGAWESPGALGGFGADTQGADNPYL